MSVSSRGNWQASSMRIVFLASRSAVMPGWQSSCRLQELKACTSSMDRSWAAPLAPAEPVRVPSICKHHSTTSFACGRVLNLLIANLPHCCFALQDLVGHQADPKHVGAGTLKFVDLQLCHSAIQFTITFFEGSLQDPATQVPGPHLAKVHAAEAWQEYCANIAPELLSDFGL